MTRGANLQIIGGTGSGSNTGATCCGDAGGPISNDNKVVSVNSFVVNHYGAGAGFSFRTDTQVARDFLRQYVDLDAVTAP
ncbi:hypothetical protein [Deinococcus yavapaiensis]|uniref:Trypsin n=1 Tax=Deinococcus yavapaiensis KR-236 TaxID=694435 RepID=A0A318S524_9DEIO|nr:hypothetical protein [Deinococcus yavapaiensis]PYE50563.1 hypothetical protein DES52_11781 [Deinococcus yavapaiensis KR-236]